ncbi:hypothetical protein AF97_24140 [Salmonella enterica]|nr:hypothetical protein [Salmonella enterica]ECC3607914.1 hypothetical protein [Salmonella enterica subsp. enterica]ECY4645552.1 hypothetical protein [Salmonella enterica subsp. enterica serovar Eastbourne]EBO9664763.1 hypothetical protein [Salmonella enterica]ECH9421188.1 hypothetical protein [Salmonella enterica subsp. enterica]
MNKRKKACCGLPDSCLVAVWLLLMILTGFVMLMLVTTRVEAAERDMPEVLRYAREYTRDRATRPAPQPEVSLSRKLARSELIRRQQRERIEALEKQLQESREAPGAGENIQEPGGAAETVRTLTQQLSEARQANEKTRLALNAAQEKTTALEQKNAALAKTRHDEDTRLTAELTSVRENAVGLEKQKAALEKTLQAMKTHPAAVSLNTDAERQAYAAGVMYARDVREAREGNRMLGVTLDDRAMNAGLNDALAENQPLRLDKNALAEATRALEKRAAQAFSTTIARQKTLAENWLKTFRKEQGSSEDTAGFWYRVTYEGDGDILKPDDTVDVVVEERLPDGRVVSDMDRAGSSLRQKVADFPPVFAAGLLRLKNHGQITLAVPPELAYGDRGYPPDVPPGAMMIYHIRVSDVIPAGQETVAGRQQE